MKTDLDDLRGFVAVAELGSFHAAADALHLSQPALTRRIQKLEATLGVQLIDRDTRQLRLSSVGREFFFKAKRVLDDLDAAVLGIRELGDRATGEVTIGGGPNRDLLFPAQGDRGLQRPVSAHPHPHPRPVGQRRAGGGQARAGRVRHQPVGRAGARPRFRAAAARPVPVRVPQRPSAGGSRTGPLGGCRALPVHHGRPAERQPDHHGCGAGRPAGPAALVLRGAAPEHVTWAWSRPGWAWRRCRSSPHRRASIRSSWCGRWSSRW